MPGIYIYSAKVSRTIGSFGVKAESRQETRFWVLTVSSPTVSDRLLPSIPRRFQLLYPFRSQLDHYPTIKVIKWN